MDTSIPRPRPKLEAPCIVGCSHPVDLRHACVVWANGNVAHIDCYNRGRIKSARPPEQRELGVGGAT